MGRGDTSLASNEYDNYLADSKKEKELRQRHLDRKSANKGYTGYHFGLGDKPVHCKDKEEFKRELDKRGLVMKDDVERELRWKEESMTHTAGELIDVLKPRVDEVERTLLLKMIPGRKPDVTFTGVWSGKYVKAAMDSIARSYRLNRRMARPPAPKPVELSTQRNVGEGGQDGRTG